MESPLKADTNPLVLHICRVFLVDEQDIHMLFLATYVVFPITLHITIR